MNPMVIQARELPVHVTTRRRSFFLLWQSGRQQGRGQAVCHAPYLCARPAGRVGDPCLSCSTVPSLSSVCSWAATRCACAAASCSWRAASSFKSCLTEDRSCAMTFSWFANALCEICSGGAAFEVSGDFQAQAAPIPIPEIRASIIEIATDGPLNEDLN